MAEAETVVLSLENAVVFIFCEAMGLPFCYSAADRLMNGEVKTGTIGFAVGLPFCIVGVLWPWIKTKVWSTNAVRALLVVGLVVAAYDIYERHAATPIANTVSVQASESAHGSDSAVVVTSNPPIYIGGTWRVFFEGALSGSLLVGVVVGLFALVRRRKAMRSPLRAEVVPMTLIDNLEHDLGEIYTLTQQSFNQSMALPAAWRVYANCLTRFLHNPSHIRNADLRQDITQCLDHLQVCLTSLDQAHSAELSDFDRSTVRSSAADRWERFKSAHQNIIEQFAQIRANQHQPLKPDIASGRRTQFPNLEHASQVVRDLQLRLQRNDSWLRAAGVRDLAEQCHQAAWGTVDGLTAFHHDYQEENKAVFNSQAKTRHEEFRARLRELGDTFGRMRSIATLEDKKVIGDFETALALVDSALTASFGSP